MSLFTLRLAVYEALAPKKAHLVTSANIHRLVVAALTAAVVLVTVPAVAQIGSITSGAASTIPTPVTPILIPTIYGTANGVAFDQSLNPILNSMNITLNTKLADMDMYIHGDQTVPPGNGLIELLMSINQEMAKVNAYNGEENEQTDRLIRARGYDQMQVDSAVRDGVSPSGAVRGLPDACASATMALAAGGGGSPSTSPSHAPGKAPPNEKLAAIADTNLSATNQAGRLYAQHNTDYCTIEDVAEKRPGCTSSPTTGGKLPGADINSSSLSAGATATPSTPTNQSFDVDQIKAALAYINMTRPMMPADPGGQHFDTPAGRVYSVKENRYRARVSPILNSYADELDLRSDPTALATALKESPVLASASPDETITPTTWQTTYQKYWMGSSVQQAWQQIFGANVPFPKSPSSWDVLRLAALWRFANVDNWQLKASSYTSDDSLRQIDAMNALQLRLTVMQMDNQRQIISLLRVIASNQLDPMTYNSLRTANNGVTETSPSGSKQ